MFEQVIRFDCVSSTQDTAREMWLRGEIPTGGVVAAREMTRGRGRRGRRWHAPPGANVCLTAVAVPDLPLEMFWKLSLFAGLSVVQGIGDLSPSTGACLRFPNDVYVWNRKLAGVLIETVHCPTQNNIRAALIGIGVNIQAAPLPPDIENRAVALETVVGEPCAVEPYETAILRRLAKNLARFETDGCTELLEDWHSLLDETAERQFLVGGEPLFCRVERVTPCGQVLFRLPHGETRELSVGAIVFGDE